jgi:cation transporter-like permease
MDKTLLNINDRKNILPENINYKTLGIVILVVTYTVIPFLIYILVKTRNEAVLHNFIVLIVLSIPVVIWLNRLITFISYRLIS